MKNIVKLSLSKDHLDSLNLIWEHFQFENTEQGKIDASICYNLRNKFLEKAHSMSKNDQKKCTFSLLYYQGKIIEIYLNKIFNFIPMYSLERSHIIQISFQLHEIL